MISFSKHSYYETYDTNIQLKHQLRAHNHQIYSSNTDAYKSEFLNCLLSPHINVFKSELKKNRLDKYLTSLN